MTKNEVIGQITNTGLIPVIRTDSADEANRVIEAVRLGGINIFEITMTVPNAVELIEKLADKFGDKVLIGTGTVLTPEIAGDCISAGAQFIISPA
ncbi:MAG: 2-dehydro-3-deoxyphosphogluconate aldolase, partial [Acidobacteriota bacterium]|nr:2-dehydro-3-deoxyphosphogluconate aldolase [Acidobacteriota bacterium]